MTGRPSKFQPSFVDQARKLCELGATDEEVASFFDVSARTIYRWQAQHEAFCQALKAGKVAADNRVERSLYSRAVGYTFDSEKVFQFRGAIVRASTKEHVPPDTTAAIFWLKNRKPDDWRDKHEVEHGGELVQRIISDRPQTDAEWAESHGADLALAAPKGGVIQ
jgi:hypothetical protein